MLGSIFPYGKPCPVCGGAWALPFLCLMELHLLWPLMGGEVGGWKTRNKESGRTQ